LGQRQVPVGDEGVVVPGRVLTEHGLPIAPSTDYAWVKAPVSAAELADAYAALHPRRPLAVLPGDVGAPGDRREVAQGGVGSVVVVVVQPA
jgi:hypothetical protein